MILKTQTYNHNMGFISKDEIKLLGEDRIINYLKKTLDKNFNFGEPVKTYLSNLQSYLLAYPHKIILTILFSIINKIFF